METASLPTLTAFDFESEESFYFSEHTTIVPETRLANCTNCAFLISVVSSDSEETAEFSLECTQELRFIKENQEYAGYLSKASKSYYEFFNPANGSVLVRLNTHQRHCIEVFVLKGNSARASASSFDMRGTRFSEFMANATSGPYSLTLEALDDCAYSVEVLTSSSQFVAFLTDGVKDLILSPKEKVYFIHERLRSGPVKLMALRNWGEVVLEAKEYATERDVFGLNTSEADNFTWSALNFLEFSTASESACYLVRVSSEFGSSLMLAVAAQPEGFPIFSDNSLADVLEPSDSQYFRVNSYSVDLIEVQMLYGDLNISVRGDKGLLAERAINRLQAQSLRLSEIMPAESVKPFFNLLFVQVKAFAPSAYTITFISKATEQDKSGRVKIGVPTDVRLRASQKHCLRGDLTDPTQEFLLSMYSESDGSALLNLSTELAVNGSAQKLTRVTGKNEVILRTAFSGTGSASYELCITSQADLAILFIQSSHINYFEEQVSVFVKDSANLSFYSNDLSLIEVNECEGRAAVTVSNSFGGISELNSKVVQWRKSNNLIEFSHYGPVFINVVAPSASLRWRRETSEEGRGYNLWAASRVRSEVASPNIRLSIAPLRKLDKSADYPILKLVFGVFVADEENELNQAMNCLKGNFTPKYVPVSLDQLEQSLDIELPIDSVLASLTPSQPYFLVGVLAEAVLQNKRGLRESYRFAYPSAQIDKRLVSADFAQKDSAQEEAPSNRLAVSFLSLITLAIVISVGASCLYLNWGKQYLRRRRVAMHESTGMSELRYHDFATSK